MVQLFNQTDSDPGDSFSAGSGSGESWCGAWPGMAALSHGDGFPLIGRDQEVERLVRLIRKPKSGQRAMVWLHGSSGVGKTSLVQAGLVPRLAGELGDGFEWVVCSPARSEKTEGLIYAIAESVLKKAVVGESGSAAVETRMRQFCLLLEQDSVESAAEYLASCFRQAMTVDRGCEEDILCLLVLDRLDRLGPQGDVFPGEESDWGEVELPPLVSFLSELCLTGVFGCVAVTRSANFSVFKKAIEVLGSQGFGTSVRLMPLDAMDVRPFFEKMPTPMTESGEVAATLELIEHLFGAGSGKNGVVSFVSETLRRLSEVDPEAETLTVEDARWAGGMERSFSFVAEKAIQDHGLRGTREAFFELMSLLYPDDDLAGNYAVERAAHMALKEIDYAHVAEWAELRNMVDVLVDAGVLVLKGDSPQRARFSWAMPAGLSAWPQSREWIEQHDRLFGLAKKFNEAREEWEKEERSPVRLLHATKAIGDARDLLDYHRRRPLLSEALIEYLEESVSLHQKLEGSTNFGSGLVKKVAGIVAGGVLLVALIIVLWKLMA